VGWTSSWISVLVLVNGVVLTGIGIYALRKRPDPMAWPLALLTFAGAAWAIPQAISFGYANEELNLFLQQLMVPGQNLVPVGYFLLAMRYAGYDEWVSSRVLAALSVFPTITITSAWTNSLHGLLWQTTSFETVGSLVVFVPEFGPWYWLNLAYVYVLIFVSLSVFTTVVIRSEPVYRKQSLLMLTGGLAPTVVNVPFSLGVGSLSMVDFTTAALGISGATFAAALFRYDVLDLSPAAYRNVSEIFGDGVLVFDEGGKLVESNARAERILDTTLTVGTPAADIFDSAFGEIDGTVFSSTQGQEFYIARYSPLHGHKDEVVGHVVVIRNITDLKEHEQRLSVTNRVLRHNLRNELNIIDGYAASLDSQLPETHEELEQIRSAANRLETVGDNARHIQSSLERTESSLRSYDATAALETVVSRFRDQHPQAQISLEMPGGVDVCAHESEQLETIFENVVENAIEHNDRDEPEVSISVEQGDETATVRIADDGPGIPSTERDALSRTQETKLEHGSSLGLWVINWLTASIGGTVAFEVNEPRGTVVVIQLQRPD